VENLKNTRGTIKETFEEKKAGIARKRPSPSFSEKSVPLVQDPKTKKKKKKECKIVSVSERTSKQTAAQGERGGGTDSQRKGGGQPCARTEANKENAGWGMKKKCARQVP